MVAKILDKIITNFKLKKGMNLLKLACNLIKLKYRLKNGMNL